MLYVKIKDDIKEAMKNKDNDTRDCLRMVVDKAKAVMKEKNPNDSSDNIPDEIVIQAIQKEVKQLSQTLESIKGENDDKFVQISQKTTHKIAILSGYLPSQMTKEDVERAVFNILTGGNYSNFGEKMRVVMNELKGKADNKLIKEVVEKFK